MSLDGVSYGQMKPVCDSFTPLMLRSVECAQRGIESIVIEEKKSNRLEKSRTSRTLDSPRATAVLGR